MGLNVTKATNQYYGKYFENAICSYINHTEIKNLTNFNQFSEEDLKIMSEDAKVVAKYLNANNAVWVGDKTSKENCDIIVDNEHIEIKYVSQGTGTYFNTSIYEFCNYGFDYRAYLNKYGFYDVLSEELKPFNIKFSRKNKSPVTQKDSSLIRHNYPNTYNTIQNTEAKIRKIFIYDLTSYFKSNPNELYSFISDMINKKTSTINKNKPDRIIVYNYTKNEISDINLNNLNYDDTISLTDKGFSVGDIRIQIGWQNGNALNNPTIRVFLK